MYLKKLSLQNFRCFGNVSINDLEKLGIFIGENDAGKSAVLAAIELLTNGKDFQTKDVKKNSDGTVASEVSVSGLFQLEDGDDLPEEYRSGANKDELFLEKRLKDEKQASYFLGRGYSDEAFDSFDDLSADAQKNLLTSYGLVPAGNKDLRADQVKRLVAEEKLARVEKELQLARFATILPFLPKTELIASKEYQEAESMIQSTLRTVASRVLKPETTTDEHARELESLEALKNRIETEVNNEVQKFREHLQKNHARLRDLSVEPSIDFTRSVGTSSLQIDVGEGLISASLSGEGTKRRLWLGVLEWQLGVARASKKNIIRLYDEPDANLHYEAQTSLFSNIKNQTTDTEARIQCFVCTHSITLIDGAPSSSIRLIEVEEEGGRQVRGIQPAADDVETIEFYSSIGKSIGLSNTAILFEKGFFLVEGPSEEIAIPILYKKIHGTSMAHDGIVVINLESCGAWRAVVRTLLANRKDMIHMFLDTDTKNEDSSAMLTQAVFEELGLDGNFEERQITFVGTKEFEDAFTADQIQGCLAQSYPRQDGRDWDVAEIQDLLDNSEKFSEALRRHVVTNCVREVKSKAKKPEIMRAVAEYIPADQIPQSVIDAIEAIRTRANLNEVADLAEPEAEGVE